MSHHLPCDLLPHLVDDYNRCRVDHFKKNGADSALSVKEWSDPKRNPHFKKLQNVIIAISGKQKRKENDYRTVMQYAVSTYLTRTIPKLQLNQIPVFNATPQSIAQYLDGAIFFVSKLLLRAQKEEQFICSFQFDLVMMMGPPLKAANEDEKDGKDDSDDEDVDVVDGGNAEIEVHGDYIGKIEEILDANNLKICSSECGVSEKDRMHIFDKKLRRKFQEQHKMNVDQCLKHKRMIGAVDMTSPPNQSNDPNRDHMVYLSESPETARNIPKNAVPEWYHGASTGNLKSDLTFSFQIKEAKRIKMYLYCKGQCIRMMAEDLHDLLPLFCSRNGNEGVHHIIGKLKKLLVDDEFASFQSTESYL